MDIPLQVTFKEMESSPAIEARIHDHLDRLGRLHGRITDCRVTIEAPHRHHQKGKIYRVTVDVIVPGAELVVNKHEHGNHAHEDVYVALRDAFAAMEKQLRAHTTKKRGEVKTHEEPLTGTIARLFPDYGFIQTPEGEVYFHRNSVVEADFEKLAQGEEVRVVMALGESEHGAQATTVAPTRRRG